MEFLTKKKLEDTLRSGLLKSDEMVRHVDGLMAAAKPYVILNTASDLSPLTDAEVKQVQREQPQIKIHAVFQAVLENRQLKEEQELPLGANRFGFVPDLPSELSWPEFQGKKFRFIAQIDLSTLPAWDGKELPRDGWLYVFAIFPPYPQKPWRSVVFHHSGRRENLKRPPKPTADEVWPIWDDDIPVDQLVSLFPRLGIDIDRQELQANHIDYQHWSCDIDEVKKKLNGQPDVDGLDRSFAGTVLGQIAEIDGSAESNIKDLMKSRVDAAAASFADSGESLADDWICLMEIGSSGSMQWSDAGSLYLIMRKSDLVKRDFSRVCMSICSA